MKMHGCGNDFVVLGDFENQITGNLAERICDRHFGIGADGVITLGINPEFAEGKQLVPKWKMRVYNSNGTEAEMCGNGIRCAAKWLVDNRYAKLGETPLMTKAGVRIPSVLVNSPLEAQVRVNMGKPVFYDPKQVSVAPGSDGSVKMWTLNENAVPGVPAIDGYYVGMGNPHAVFFVSDGNAEPFANQYGPLIEKATHIFPQKTNVHFVEEGDFGKFRVYTWERGDGRTLACGTGACAVYVAATMDTRIPVGTPAEMILPGGELDISWTGKDNPVFMTGPAKNVSPVSLDFLV